MLLRPVEKSDFDLVASWMTAEENYKWLDFGQGIQALNPMLLGFMLKRRFHSMWVYTADDDVTPIGVVGLANVDRTFKTAELWYVLGEKSYAGKGYATRAVSKDLTIAFDELGLEAIHAWAVDKNTASVRVLEKCGFRFLGRQRSCHHVDGEVRDRLHYDLLAIEHTSPR